MVRARSLMPRLLVPVEQPEHRRGGLGKRERAATIEGRQAGVEQGGHRGRSEALGGYATAGREELPRGQGRRGPLSGHDLDGAGLRVVDHDRDLAPEADGGGVRDGQREDRRDRGVHGIPAALEDLEPRRDCSAPPATTAPFLPDASQIPVSTGANLRHRGERHQ